MTHQAGHPNIQKFSDPGEIQNRPYYDYYFIIIIIMIIKTFLQCFDAVGWVAGRASGL